MRRPEVVFRPARRQDVDAIVKMLANDRLGAQREAYGPELPQSYFTAFEAIDADPNQELVVAEIEERVVGVVQLSFLPGMSYRGSWRLLIEGVRVSTEVRSGGIGSQMILHAIERAKARGCRMVQLTSNKSRVDAIRFYERLGFTASHEGLKLMLPGAEAA